MRKKHQPGCPCCVDDCDSIHAYFGVQGCCNTPIVGATVTITGPSPATTTFTGTTDSAGSCVIDLAPGGPGVYSWSIAATGYTTLSGTFTASCGRNFVYGGLMAPDTTTRPPTITLTDPGGTSITLGVTGGPLNYGWTGTQAYTVSNIVGPSAYGCIAGQTGTVTVTYGVNSCGAAQIKVPIWAPFGGQPSLCTDDCATDQYPIDLTPLVSSPCRPIAGTFGFTVHSPACYDGFSDCCHIGPGTPMDACDLAKIWGGLGRPFDYHD